jgi:hypothetical protein
MKRKGKEAEEKVAELSSSVCFGSFETPKSVSV